MVAINFYHSHPITKNGLNVFDEIVGRFEYIQSDKLKRLAFPQRL